MVRHEFYNPKHVSFQIIDPNKVKWKNCIEMTENSSAILLKKIGIQINEIKTQFC